MKQKKLADAQVKAANEVHHTYGVPMSKIAAISGVSQQAITKRFSSLDLRQQMGQSLRRFSDSFMSPPSIALAGELYKNGYSYEEIGRISGFSHIAIRQNLIDAGIEPRERSDAMRVHHQRKGSE